MESVDKDPDKWISHLEELRIQMIEFGQTGSITKDFMIHVLNNLPKDYDVALNGLENCPVTGDDALTINVIREKLNHRYNKMKN